MSDLQTNVIALPVPERSISWHRYEAGSADSNGDSHSAILSACHRLLDARVPCLWRPRGALDDAAGVLEAIAKGSAPAIGPGVASGIWEVWVFHALAPEHEARSRDLIPLEFKATDEGEIMWNASPLLDDEQEHGGSGNATAVDIHSIFHRALDNLIDRALMQLSMVRFGFRQWIGPDQAPQPVPRGPGRPKVDGPQSAHECTPLDADQFAAHSAALDDSRVSGGEEPADADCGSDTEPGACILRMTVSTCPQGLLVQHCASRAPFLRPVAESDAATQQPPQQLPGGEENDDSMGTLRPVAAVRIAPYGVSAKLIAVPDQPVGDTEETTLSAWAVVFGYSRQFLAGPDARKQPAPSSLVWIAIGSEEPMLYPRRLVYVDTEETLRMHSSGQGDGRTSAPPAAAAVPATPAASDALPALPTQLSPPSREEGEDDDQSEEGEFDEEGEIADPVVPVATPTGLDEVVAQLSAETSRSVERSLATIKETMAQFQVELQAEEEREQEARRKARAAAEAKAAKAAGGTNGTRKRQRSITKGSAPNKARRKLDNATLAPAAPDAKPDAKPDVKPYVATEDIPLQALMAFTTPPEAPPAAATEPTPAPAFGGADDDLDALFGGGADDMDGPGLAEGSGAQGGIGLGFGPMGDDIGMGIDMGLGDDLDAGMGDFGTNIFGVTDDDFSFFDTAPPLQIKVDTDVVPLSAAGSAGPAASSFDADAKLSSSLQDMAVEVGALTAADHPAHEAADDPFDDDGMFDSFFGGPATLPDGAAAASDVAEFGDTAGTTTAQAPGTAASTLPPSISSPPGIASVLSTTETHVGSAEPLLSSGMDVDLATPVSIRATPAHSADLLAPTPTPSGAQLTKTPAGGDSAGLPASSVGGAGLDEPSVPALATGAARSAQPAARKPSTEGVRNAAAVPAPYSLVCTAFDDIGSSSRSWLRDGPTPMHINDDNSDDTGAGELVLQRLQATSLVEKSLNPAAWAKRVATRRQRLLQRGRGGGTGARRLQGWLAKYRAKLSYTGGFVPAGVRAPRAASKVGAADATAIGPAAAANLQYPPVGTAVARERATDSHLPSFMSIISTGAAQLPCDHGQMPGALPLSVGVASLQTVATRAAQPEAAAVVVRTTVIAGPWVPLWMQVSGAAAECLVGTQPACSVTWAAALSALICATRRVLCAAADAHTYRAEIRLAGAAAVGGVAQAGNLGARLGGLLSLGAGWSYDAGAVPSLSQHQLPDAALSTTTVAASDALGRWGLALQGGDSWAPIVEMLAGWAVSSSLLRCVRGQGPRQASGPDNDRDVPWVGGALAAALESFWDAGDASGRAVAGGAKRTSSGGSDSEQPAACGPLGLARLVALANAAASPTAKYGGYVVKKRRTVTQPAAAAATATAVVGGSDSLVVIQVGPGTIEPLVRPAVLVGTYGEADMHVPASSSGVLRRRDAESLYIRRWRHAQTLAGRAMHEARVAAGEIEETEEGEEREDGEDAAPGPAAAIDEDEWPDPDAWAPAAEDAQRRVCVATSSTSLRWWRPMQMRPIGASKDVRWVALVPPPLPAASHPSSLDDGIDGWCRASSTVAEWYLGDVDSAYQAAHLGTHGPLGLHRPLDGVFTQQTKDTMPPPQVLPPGLPWSAQLRYEAERLGRCTAHAWYTSSQQQQQQQPPGPVAAATATVVFYMLVPHSASLVPWAALSEAAVAATRAFEAALGSLIARTSGGIGHVPWPAVVVHPLPLDMLSEWHRGGRAEAAPSAHETAMAIYNCCPKPLVLPPSSAAPAAPSKATVAAGSSGGSGSAHIGEFLVAVAAAVPTVRSAAGSGCLVRFSGYTVRSGPQWADGSGVPAFAQRAFVVSAPCAFPVPSSAVAPAAIPASRAFRRSDIVARDNNTHLQQQLPVTPRQTLAYPPSAEPPARQPPLLPPSPQPAAPAALAELDETCVAFAWRLDDPDAKRQQEPRADRSPYAQLVSHPLRSCDAISTLHCVYTSAAAEGAGGPWVAVCWCDERGEYVEHDVFASRNAGPGLSAAAAARIWRGCLRYQALAGGMLRVVLAEWQGMALGQARDWAEYAAAWRAHAATDSIHLHLASVGVAPRDGLRLTRNPTAPGCPAAAQDEPMGQWSLVLHAQPYIAFGPTGCQIAEALDACSSRACPTGYLVLQDRQPPRCTGEAIPCLCVQLLDHAVLGPHPCTARSAPCAPKMHALTARALLRQYHQLACLTNAELDATGRPMQGPPVRVCGWPAHLLPLPVAVVLRIRAAVDLLPAAPAA